MLIAGTAGAGKSTLARQVAEALDLPYVELDSLFHGPSWTPRPEFVTEVDGFTRGDRWICEWQYRAVRPMLASRAETIVWLDFPRWLVMWRVLRRTVTRFVRNTELWNGNREPSLWHAFTNPEGIIRWAWDTHARNREQILEAAAEHDHLELVRLRSPREARDWLDGLE